MANPYPWKNDEFKFMSFQDLIDVWERAGYVYESSVEYTIPTSGTYYTAFETGDRPVVIFDRNLCYNGVGVTATVTRPSDVDGDTPGTFTGGTLCEIFNANDINPQANYSDPEEGQDQGDKMTCSTTSLVVLSGDWINTRAPRPIFGSESNQSAGAPIQAISTPQIVGPLKTIMFGLKNRSSTGSQTVASYIRWASVPNIDDYIFNESGVLVRYTGPIEQL